MENLIKRTHFAIYTLLCVCFWRGTWGKLTLIATIEVIGHALLRLNDWTFPMLWHLISWSIWLVAIIIIRVVRRVNYA